MKAVYFLGNRQLAVRETPDPSPGPGEVVIEVKASGMCGSDLKIYRNADGPAALGLPGEAGEVIAGHEPCGVIAEVGAGVPERVARIGMRVMNHHYAGCGVCRHCNSGWTQMCDDGATVFGMTGNGAHARYMKAPAISMVPLIDDLSFETGAAISCGTGTAWGALERLELKGMQTIAIFGQGPVGLSATQLASAMGARVIALDIDPGRLDRAREFGADQIINAATEEVVPAIMELTSGLGADCTLDSSGVPLARLQAVQSIRKWGKVVFVGEGGELTVDVSSDLNRKQATLMGSWTFSRNGQADCAKFIADRKLDIDGLFTHRWPVEEAVQAYALFDTQTTGKGVLIPS